jgi:hypothetical protein
MVLMFGFARLVPTRAAAAAVATGAAATFGVFALAAQPRAAATQQIGGSTTAVDAATVSGPLSPAAWRATGTLLESCTCAVPCSCNFGEGPSPHPYCHAVFAYKLDPGSAWGTTDLSGLVFGGADGPKGNAGFLDARATREQRAALQMIAGAVFAQGGPANGPRAWTSVPITHTVNGNDLRLDLGGARRFSRPRDRRSRRPLAGRGRKQHGVADPPGDQGQGAAASVFAPGRWDGSG